MTRKWLLSLSLLLILFSCSKEKPEIRTATELTQEGKYIIKWETYPSIDGKVNIYTSSSPESFDLSKPPYRQENIDLGYTIVSNMPKLPRAYFELVFDGGFRAITSTRVIPMERVFNFRDLGGYNNRNGQQLKWGKLYRSSSITTASKNDIETIRSLGIKTSIDLRSDLLFQADQLNYPIERMYNLPFRGNGYNVFSDQIIRGKMTRTEIVKHLQEVFYFFSENNTDYLIDLFNILLDESNYPVVFYCSLGKDRSAMVSAIILAALDVNENTIIDDYLLSNDLINYHALAENASEFTPAVQESMTALFSAHRETIVYTLEKIKEEYGSLDNYLENELQLTRDKRTKLKQILIYP